MHFTREHHSISCYDCLLVTRVMFFEIQNPGSDFYFYFYFSFNFYSQSVICQYIVDPTVRLGSKSSRKHIVCWLLIYRLYCIFLYQDSLQFFMTVAFPLYLTFIFFASPLILAGEKSDVSAMPPAAKNRVSPYLRYLAL